jgi:hypothetical protein
VAKVVEDDALHAVDVKHDVTEEYAVDAAGVVDAVDAYHDLAVAGDAASSKDFGATVNSLEEHLYTTRSLG